MIVTNKDSSQFPDHNIIIFNNQMTEVISYNWKHLLPYLRWPSLWLTQLPAAVLESLKIPCSWKNHTPKPIFFLTRKHNLPAGIFLE